MQSKNGPVRYSSEKWCSHVLGTSVWRHSECMPCAALPGVPAPALLFLFFLHFHVPRCGVDVICSPQTVTHRAGEIVSGLCLHPLVGHALYSACPAQHLIPHELTMLHFEHVTTVHFWFFADLSYVRVPFVEIRNKPCSA